MFSTILKAPADLYKYTWWDIWQGQSSLQWFSMHIVIIQKEDSVQKKSELWKIYGKKKALKCACLQWDRDLTVSAGYGAFWNVKMKLASILPGIKCALFPCTDLSLTEHYVEKFNSAWTSSCLYPKMMGHIIRILTIVIMIIKRKC